MSNPNKEVYLLNRTDLDWALYVSEIKNNTDGLINLEANNKIEIKTKNSSSSLIKSSNNILDKNNIEESNLSNAESSKNNLEAIIRLENGNIILNGYVKIEDSLEIVGIFKSSNIDLNNISKTLQTLYYSPDKLYPLEISNHYINASNLKYYNSLSNELLSDFSINIIPIGENSKFKLITNLNYLTSNYNNTKLELELYFNIDPSGGFLVDNSEVLISNCVLGNDNTTFVNSIFSNVNVIDISNEYQKSYNLGDKIIFYYKVRNYNEGNFLIDYSNNVANNYKSTIMYERKGNNLILEEINIPNFSSH